MTRDSNQGDTVPAGGAARRGPGQPVPDFDPAVAALPLIRLALAEDLGESGDLTSSLVLPADRAARGRLVARAPGVLAGIDVARKVFHEIDPVVAFAAHRRDGDVLVAGDVLAVILGPARSLLTAERTALNFLQRLSGVATLTARYAGKLAGTSVRVLDTRKTTPGYRALEKHAVRMGGGWNHRQGLHDMILIKDNHIVAAGGIAEAIRAAAAGRPGGIAIEVEVAGLAELEAALDPEVDGILLDNMTPAEVRAAVARIGESPHRPWIEISGGVSLETIGEYAIPGVDFISIGRLTHSAPALDLALDFEFDAAGGGSRP